MSDAPDSIPFTPPTAEELAVLFPGYEMEGLIASGGMGAVYCALQRSLDRRVAIKLLPAELSGDATFRTRFEAEAKAMAKLNHPNLIGVYDFGEAGGMLYIIMEFVPGQSLYHSANGIAIDAREVVRLVSAVCDGISHAHQHGIIHRDIKPANILLDLKANPKVGDFGLARPVEHKDAAGEDIYGTPGYTAPEVIHDPMGVDHRADIFSLGVLLHELLTGKLPDADPRAASAIIHCDPRFDAVVKKATDPNRDHRYGDAADIAAELRKIDSSHGPRVLQTASGPKTGPLTAGKRKRPAIKPKKSNPLPAILVLLLAIGAVLVAYQKVAEFQKKEHARVIKEQAEKEAKRKAESEALKARAQLEYEARQKIKQDAIRLAQEAKERERVANLAIAEAERIKQEAAAAATGTTEHPDQSVGMVTDTPPAKFDVDGFLTKARTKMKERVSPAVSEHQSAIKANLADFERETKRAIRKAHFDNYREHATETLRSLMEEAEAGDHRIPSSVEEIVTYAPAAQVPFKEAVNKEKAIDAKLREALGGEASTYVRGINIQIERLADDPGAVAALKQEISRTEQDEDYFANLMLGTAE